DTPEGRALNRRVTVRFFSEEQVSDAILSVRVGDSGINKDRASETADSADEENGAESGFLNINDGMMVVHPVLAVSARLDSRLRPRLLLDGERVDDARIGSRLADESSNTTV